MHMSLYSGRRLDCAHPDPAQIHIVDIARSLAREGRCANHTEDFYSVAQHSLLVCELVGLQPGATLAHRRAGLMHDAHEAITRDIATPVARELDALAPGALARLKARYQGVIDQRFGVAWDTETHERVAQADRRALVVEKQDLRIEPALRAGRPGRPPVPLLQPMGWQQAYTAFIERYMDLWGLP
jgi:5'-deoxynucleotidase YfbR-like HD superfamily hydrolase